MMRSGWALIAVIGLVVGSAPYAAAQSQGCTYEGQRYEEGMTICQAGLKQNCVNGTWQSLDGARCGAGDDQQVEPSEGLQVLPQGGFAED